MRVYQPHAIELAPGDRLLIVTDGFTEAHDPDNAIYGEGRVEAFFAGLMPSEGQPLERLAADVRAFEAGRPAFRRHGCPVAVVRTGGHDAECNSV